MDTVRFGRALGIGARQAVKTLVTAVDAATAENPSGKGANAAGSAGQGGQVRGTGDSVATEPRSASPPASQPVTQTAAATSPAAASPAATREPARTAPRAAARTVAQVRDAPRGLRRGSRRFAEAAWGPVVRLSGVLWLEVAGVFFGMVTLFALEGVWKWRGGWHGGAAGHRQLLGAVAMLALFGYFCVSSFVRARRRERRR